MQWITRFVISLTLFLKMLKNKATEGNLVFPLIQIC